MKAVILAGGSGTRLWPASTQATPKQFLSINNEGSLLMQTLRRCSVLGAGNDNFVVTNARYAEQAKESLKAFDVDTAGNVILEPCPRNTAPAILLAAKYLEQFDGATANDVMMVFPSDHIMETDNVLVACFELGRQMASQGRIVTFGITPTHPETGYGYIKRAALPEPGETSGTIAQAFSVDSFREKPDFATAKSFLAEGCYYWNAGIFALTLGTLYKEIATHLPEIVPFLALNYTEMEARFAEMPNISMDFAIMEKTTLSVVIPLVANWSDVGSWDSMYELLPKDENGNAIQGRVVATETMNCLLFNTTPEPMAVMGMHNVIAVMTANGLMISPLGQSQKVKNLSGLFATLT